MGYVEYAKLYEEREVPRDPGKKKKKKALRLSYSYLKTVRNRAEELGRPTLQLTWLMPIQVKP